MYSLMKSGNTFGAGIAPYFVIAFVVIAVILVRHVVKKIRGIV